MSKDFEECERCEHERPPEFIETVEVDEAHELCEGCREDIEARIEDYYWYDRYDEDTHERAVEELESVDEILCVHDNYESGDIIVHTNYVSSSVVKDFCDNFGFQIMWFTPRWQEEEIDDGWSCVAEQGSCFEIELGYTSRSPPPIPEAFDFEKIELGFLSENDEQFDANQKT